jgi:hypothetical protein
MTVIGEGAWHATPDADVITVVDVDAGLSASRRERSRIAAASAITRDRGHVRNARGRWQG